MVVPFVYQLTTSLVAAAWMVLVWRWQWVELMANFTASFQGITCEKTIDKSFNLAYNNRTAFGKRILFTTGL